MKVLELVEFVNQPTNVVMAKDILQETRGTSAATVENSLMVAKT